MTKYAECPFCYKEPEALFEDKMWIISCVCGVHTSHRPTLKLAEALWESHNRIFKKKV